MANQWRYRIGKSNNGPVSSKQLKQLCNEGIVEPDTPVRRNDMDKWVRAKSIKGLFATEPAKNGSLTASEDTESIPFREPSEDSTSHPGGTEAVPLRYRLPVIIPLLACCFPIALILIWKRPDWTTQTKFIWTGGFAALLVISQVSMNAQRSKLKQRFETASKQWDSGERERAVLEYRELVGPTRPLLSDSQEILIYSRLVEHAIENGHEGEARRLMKESGEFANRLALSSDAANGIRDQIIAERASNQQKVQARQAASNPVRLERAALFGESQDQRVRFEDQTESFEGKAVQMEMVVDKFLPSFNKLQSEIYGVPADRVVQFYVYSDRPDTRFGVVIDIPEGFATPTLHLSDKFMVTFMCHKGSTQFGNQLLNLERL